MDLAAIMQAIGMENAFNLDGGGSSAMIYDGQYKVGPGRNIPNALIFIKK
jgi:exopolysaccharide biosynthesis protein